MNDEQMNEFSTGTHTNNSPFWPCYFQICTQGTNNFMACPLHSTLGVLISSMHGLDDGEDLERSGRDNEVFPPKPRCLSHVVARWALWFSLWNVLTKKSYNKIVSPNMNETFKTKNHWSRSYLQNRNLTFDIVIFMKSFIYSSCCSGSLSLWSLLA